MFKRVLVMLLAVAFISLAFSPDTFACHRRRSRAAAYGYSPYRYRGVAADRYYYGGRRDGIGSTGRAILTVAAPAAIGAGAGALLGGKKGAAVGALLGGGGGAAYYLIKHRSRRY
ncbi:MAG TPA: hypothetical protein VNN73_09450 [Blastocatellia bacterium]|nr:hypothetical protein [Blastocatellia bacterium]